MAKKKSEAPVETNETTGYTIKKEEVFDLPIKDPSPEFSAIEETKVVDKVVSRGLNGVATTVKKTLKPVKVFEAMQGVWKKTWIEE